MKRILISIVIIALGYFIFGFVAVLLKWFDKDLYLTLSAIIGGVASVSGLLAFASSRLKKEDIENVGIEYFKKVVESSEELKKKEEELQHKELELDTKEKELMELEIKKSEIELLVRKASMALFLKDQFERTQYRINEIKDENKELSKLLLQYVTYKKQLQVLDQEISVDENSEILAEIIAEVNSIKSSSEKLNRPKSFIDAILETSDSILRILYK
ncbi:MAG: hypothetical protein IPH62_00730 [Ignavibacteriae bacterium]|nr:hypothetical protein [Ignavibacteriota bacterium]